VPAFEPTEAQRAALAARLPRHELVSVMSEPEFLAELPLADAAVVWRFLAEWCAHAPRLRHLVTPAAGREPCTRFCLPTSTSWWSWGVTQSRGAKSDANTKSQCARIFASSC